MDQIETALIAGVVALTVSVIGQVINLQLTRITLNHQAKQAGEDRIERSKLSTEQHQQQLGQLQEQHKEAQRAEWKSYLVHLMDQLIAARYEYEEFLGQVSGADDVQLKTPPQPAQHAKIVGKAIAACIATNDDLMIACSEGSTGLTPYFVKAGQEGAEKNWDSRNRDALQAATKRLAELIKAA